MRSLKALGQNFLTSTAIASEIVSQAEITAGDSVWEIGPGQGILTRALVSTACTLTAFELDRRLAQPLQEEFGQSVNLVMGDILKVNWDEELARYPQQIKLVANIPYQITSPLLSLLEKYNQHFAHIVLMVQKEVAERICASPGKKDYGVMTLRLRRLFDAQILIQVGREHFAPVPAVDSAVISLKPRAIPPLIPDLKKYLLLIRLAFAHRRKTLRNNLSPLGDKARLEKAQSTSGIDLSRRGETLSEAEFILLSQHL